jgi:uncharacterized membrane-anchored protein YitT (DUF2179 family)
MNHKQTNSGNAGELFSTYMQMIIGVGLAVFALKGFMIPNHFLDGGVIGIALLTHELLGYNLSMLLIIGNVLFILLAYHHVSKETALRSTVAVLILCVGLEFVDIEPVTTDKILTAIFGGAILGAGVGMVIRAGGALDGTEILVVLTQRRIGLSMSELIMLMNTGLFLTAAIYLGIETAMFSIITYFCATKMIDYVVDGIDEFTGMTVISGKSERIKSIIVSRFGKGITVYKGQRGFLPGTMHVSSDCDIIMTVVTRLELLKIKKAILQEDPNAFIYVQNIKEASGGVLSKTPPH